MPTASVVTDAREYFANAKSAIEEEDQNVTASSVVKTDASVLLCLVGRRLIIADYVLKTKSLKKNSHFPTEQTPANREIRFQTTGYQGRI